MSRTKKNTQNNKYPRLGLVGLGPVGLILATHFKEAGCEIAICDHDKVKMNLIQREGVRLEGTIEKHVFFEHVYSSLGEMNEWKPEIIFFAVKTHHMPHVLEEATFLKKDDVLVVSAQNGIDAEQFLADAFGENRTIRMVINFAGNLNAPNVVKVTFFNPPNYIASIDDTQSEVAQQLAEILNTVSLDTKPTDSFDILKRVWIKTILNSALSALCGIGKLTIKEAMEIPDTVEIVEQIILEAVEVAEAEKIKFEDDFVRKCLRYLRKAGPHFPSLAVDLINNRPTEIDFFNGKIVEYGRKHYIRTPLNLAFTNMVKAITHRNLMTLMPGLSSGTSRMPRRSGATTTRPRRRASQKDRHFLGIDLGSAYTKLTVIDEDENVVFQTVLKTINRDKVALKHVLETIHQDFPIQFSCATGYGRKHFPDADIIKTEINCAAVGGARSLAGEKNIIDIGGEDIKVIRCNAQNNVEHFYLNNKCAAGTGAFITEIAERAELEISEMSRLAAKSNFNQELNSFCTVFAKTEIMGWLFNGLAKADIARGIYLSIANRTSKLRVDVNVPILLIGGVIAYHPFLRDLLEEKFHQKVIVAEKPIYVVSLGAALIAKYHYLKNRERSKEVEVVE